MAVEKLPLMARGAKKLVDVCANVQPGEYALVVTDMRQDPALAQALASALAVAGANVQIMTTDVAKSDSGAVPAPVAAAMRAADVVFTPVSVSLTHTEAVREACAGGTRVVALTQWSAEMMMGGGIDADFAAIEPRVREMARIWDEGETVAVTTAAGTDLSLDIRGRLGTPHAKTGIVRRGEFHPVPDIESPVSPVTAEGVIICDASIPYLGIGVLDEPVCVNVERGKVTSITGGHAARVVREQWEAFDNPNVYNIAEIGIGMNPHCRLIGLMLEDEGVASTCHIGIGTSITLGGTVTAPCHYDFIMHDPTISVDGRVVMDAGVLRI
ncbi:aminopeptidase [Pelagibacterium lacus]|uniref:Leucyl aminopeptidase n=1 Tax=Pelagibacterium lacus TaxID=2282655 RepID=A0A369W6K0_9HYPH|nr:leucyl aminopeptidase [Pelagibacterium lacus]RDE07701.1 leucyl aminopeptidase [Pelagibacterium lacus]